MNLRVTIKLKKATIIVTHVAICVINKWFLILSATSFASCKARATLASSPLLNSNLLPTEYLTINPGSVANKTINHNNTTTPVAIIIPKTSFL